MVPLYGHSSLIALSFLGMTSFSAFALRPAQEDLLASRWPSAKERGAYRCFVAATGEPLWEASWETTVLRDRGSVRLKISEQGRGVTWRSKGPIVWEKQMALQVAPEVKVQSVKGSRWDSQGKTLSRLELKTDPIRKRLKYEDIGLDGFPETAFLPWDLKVIPDELLFHWIRTLDFERDPAGECVLLVSPTRRFRVRAWVRGTEEVSTPAGTFLSYRVELSPRLGPLQLTPLRALLPKTTLWVTAQDPHFWVRYLGPAGGVGLPRAVIELVRFEQTGAPGGDTQ